MQQHFINNWRQLLTNLLGWSGDQIDRWIAWRWDEGELEQEDSIIYYSPPASWLVRPILKVSGVRTLNQNEFQNVERHLLLALDAYKHDFTGPTNWQQYRQQVNRILAEYGGKLPQVISVARTLVLYRVYTTVYTEQRYIRMSPSLSARRTALKKQGYTHALRKPGIAKGRSVSGLTNEDFRKHLGTLLNLGVSPEFYSDMHNLGWPRKHTHA